MQLTIISLLTAVVGGLLWFRNRFTVLELLLLWLLISTTNQVVLAVEIVNLKRMQMTETMQAFLAMHGVGVFFIPLLIVLFIDRYSDCSRFYQRGLLIILVTIILTFAEYSLDWAGVVKHVDWKPWWSVVSWLGMVLLALGYKKFVNYLTKNGGDAYAA